MIVQVDYQREDLDRVLWSSQESLSSLIAGEESVNQEELLSRFRTIINENLLLKGTVTNSYSKDTTFFYC